MVLDRKGDQTEMPTQHPSVLNREYRRGVGKVRGAQVEKERFRTLAYVVMTWYC